MEAIVGQLQYVLASFAWGVALMFFYDFILVFRYMKKHGRFGVFIEDWIFWAVAAILVFRMIFALNNGVLRSFFVFAFLLGMVGYRRVVKERLQKGVVTVCHWIVRPYVWVCGKIRMIRKKTLK